MPILNHAVERMPFDSEIRSSGLNPKRLAERIHAVLEHARWHMARWRACRDLLAMPDHLLKDIGIDRSGIDSAVENGR
jgi:uncharacterized protein YjiS (DUF1127 family)